MELYAMGAIRSLTQRDSEAVSVGSTWTRVSLALAEVGQTTEGL